MRWAILDGANIVTSIVEQDDAPAGSVKAPDGSGYAVGKVWNGWGFEGQRLATYDFLLRFTTAEFDAILAAALTDATTRRFLAFCESAHEVRADDQTTVDGMAYLVTQGLLSSSRRDEILGA
jgi:hypothetical protein